MKPRVLLISLLAIALMLSACLPSAAHSALAQHTATPTPFLPGSLIVDLPEDQPVIAIEQPAPEDGVTYGDFAPATALSDIEVPPPLGTYIKPEGQINILLMGSDQRPNDGGYRTDVMLLVTLNPADDSVRITSFPRDLYVFEPGWRVDRINSAQARGGFEMTAQTLEYNFGVRPDHYVLINFQGFINLVDTLGGINVNVAQGLTDEREGPGDYSVPAGNVSMDGETALWYVRSRGTASDFDRTRRQQEVLTAIFFRLLSLNAITQAPQLYDQYKQTVVTDLGLSDILPLLPLAATVGNNNNIQHYAIGPNDVQSFTTSGGGAVLIPLQDKVRVIMAQAISPVQ
jgi:LCP family protein required for cell wall assembly